MTARAIGKFILKHHVPMQVVLVAAASYVGGIIVNSVSDNTETGLPFWVYGASGFIVVLLLTLISALFEKIIRTMERDREREHTIHRTGYETLNREMSEYIGLSRDWEIAQPSAASAPRDMMMRAMGDLYSTLEAEYGPGTTMAEHIEFEVTFMTESLLDGKITIAAWANRTGRAPKSLASRQSDQHFYEGTETDKLYHDPNRSPRFIDSTDGQQYKELYTGQKQRIKSSVIYPVVDDKYYLLGTLVVHCDRTGFFKASSQKFWTELLEPYTKRLALGRVLAARLKDEISVTPTF